MPGQPYLTFAEWQKFDESICDDLAECGGYPEEIFRIEGRLAAQMIRRYKPKCRAYERFRRSLVPSIADAVAEFQDENCDEMGEALVGEAFNEAFAKAYRVETEAMRFMFKGQQLDVFNSLAEDTMRKLGVEYG